MYYRIDMLCLILTLNWEYDTVIRGDLFLNERHENRYLFQLQQRANTTDVCRQLSDFSSITVDILR